jgi:hypothetical protein
VRKHLNKAEAVKVALENELQRTELAQPLRETSSAPLGSSAGPAGRWPKGG